MNVSCVGLFLRMAAKRRVRVVKNKAGQDTSIGNP
jgi:hypothetical protein